MRRVLIFNDSLVLGGTEILLLNTLCHLVKQGCEVTLILPKATEKNVLLDKVPKSVKIKYLQKIKASYWRNKIEALTMVFFPSLFRCLKGIRSKDYDVAVCFKESYNSQLIVGMKCRTVLWVHNILYRRKCEIKTFKEKFTVRFGKKIVSLSQNNYVKYNKIICVSEACRLALIDMVYKREMSQHNINVLYNAIDTDIVKTRSREEIIPLPQGRTNFVLVTRNSVDKRIDRLIQAVTRLSQESYNFHVYVIGDGMEESLMMGELRKKGIQDKISLLGRVENPYPYMLQANWSLCVSERESFSLVLLESMALRTPVITTDCGGPRDIVEGGKYGILVDNSGEGVYNGMKLVLDNPSLSIKYSENLHSAVVKYNYASWLASVDEILGLA